jgi:hypothetical protein
VSNEQESEGLLIASALKSGVALGSPSDGLLFLGEEPEFDGGLREEEEKEQEATNNKQINKQASKTKHPTTRLPHP